MERELRRRKWIDGCSMKAINGYREEKEKRRGEETMIRLD